MSEPTPLSAERPYSRDELVHLAENMRHSTVQQIVGAAEQKTINRLLATIDAQATEIAAPKGAQRTLDWLDEGWEFPCPSCGGGCYRSRALEKQHCYACGAAFPPEVLRVLAGKEAQGGD